MVMQAWCTFDENDVGRKGSAQYIWEHHGFDNDCSVAVVFRILTNDCLVGDLDIRYLFLSAAN